MYAMWGSGINVNGRTAVQSWYDEVKYYNYRSPGFSGKTGDIILIKNLHFQYFYIQSKILSTYITTLIQQGISHKSYGKARRKWASPLRNKETEYLSWPITALMATCRDNFNQMCFRKARETFSEFEIEALKAHNEFRELHGAPPLIFYANEWAKYLAGRNTLQHRTERTYGENLYAMWGSGINVNGRAAVQSWYDEVKNYNHSYPVFGMNTGHFTQVVWKSTTEMGIAIMKAGNGVFVVANYSPHGNMQGQFQANVFPRG
ncbi:hypothetical protein B566_EDAN013018, partial [Ephemera danica]